MKYTHFFLIIAISDLHEAKLKNANVRRPREAEKEKKPPCDEDQLMLYLAEIQVINPENIINLATFEELNMLCSKVASSLSTMDNYLKTCVPPQQNDLYIELIKGVDALYEKLCTESKFRKEFKENQKCLHDLHSDFEDCNGPADWIEDGDKARVCKIYREIADCYYVKSVELCGYKAASLLKELIMAVINSVLVVKCDGVRSNPTVADPMPPFGGKEKICCSTGLPYIYLLILFTFLH